MDVTPEELALEAACRAFLHARGEDPSGTELVALGQHLELVPAWRTIIAPMRAAIRAFLEPRCSYEPEDEVAWAICGWLAEVTPDEERGNDA